MNTEDLQSILVMLEVARRGSISHAAEALGVSQPTVSRHVRAFEEALGMTLFVRHARGVRPTAQAEELLMAAAGVEDAMKALERVARGVGDEVSGTVRIAASEIIGVEVLAPKLSTLREAYPNLNIELVLDNRPANLERGEADIAVRLFRPTGLDLIARLVGSVPSGFYASTAYLDRHGRPTTIEGLLEHDLIGFDPRGPMRDLFAAADPRFTPDRFNLATDSLTAQLAAARAGAGIAALQRPIAESYPELELIDLGEMPQLPLWTATHEDLRHAPHIRATITWLHDTLERYIGNHRSH